VLSYYILDLVSVSRWELQALGLHLKVYHMTNHMTSHMMQNH